MTLNLRLAQLTDAEFIYQLRFSESVRHASLSSDRPAYQEHVQWLQNSLGQADRLILIALLAELPIGVVRFDISGDTAEVSIYLAESARNQGKGSELINAAEAFLKNNSTVKQINARVLCDNEVSLNFFGKNGYTPQYVLLKKKL